MANDDRVLSQAEIDALLSSSAPAPKAPAPPPVKAAAAPPPAPKAAAPPVAAPAAAPVRPAAVPVSAVKVAVSPPPKPAPAPAAAAPPPAPAPAPAPAPQIIQQGMTQEQVTSLCRKLLTEETGELAKQMVELTIKMNNFKKRIDHIEGKIDEMADMVQQSPAIDDLAGKIEELQSLILNMRRRGTDEEHIRDQFHCVKCHSEKLVAVHVKCTSCGTENWMGWYPDSPASGGETGPEHY